MLLRSSSTPVLGSLISSVPESPNNNHHHHHHVETNPLNKHLPPPPGHPKLSIHHHPVVPKPLPVSCNSSPISPSLVDTHKGLRRVQSDGNLEGLAYVSYNDKTQDCPNNTNSNKTSKKPPTKMLQTIPSFSFFSSRGEREEEADEMMSDIEDAYEYESDDDRSEKGNDKVVAVASSEYNHLDKIMNTALNHDKAISAGPMSLGFGGEKELIPQQMYLAKGLGIGSYAGGGKGGSSGGKGFNPADFGDGGNKQDIEEHYKKMVEENPGNPLCLRNYAHFLYKTKQDLEGAEAYYSRAILADPTDGDILSQYAQLVWELNHDRDRALSYFERAAHASPEDSHVQAAYANFLWETEEDEDECDLLQKLDDAPHFHNGAIGSVVG